MFTQDLAAWTDDKHRIVEPIAFPLRAPEKYGSFQCLDQFAHLLHPWVGLRLYPIGPDDMCELKSTDRKLRRHDPLGAYSGSVFDGLDNHVSIPLDCPGNCPKMKQRDLARSHITFHRTDSVQEASPEATHCPGADPP